MILRPAVAVRQLVSPYLLRCPCRHDGTPGVATRKCYPYPRPRKPNLATILENPRTPRLVAANPHNLRLLNRMLNHRYGWRKIILRGLPDCHARIYLT